MIGFLPDVAESSVADADHFSVKVGVGAGRVKGTLDISFETLEKEAGHHAMPKGHGKGMQSTVDIAMRISLEDTQGGSQARWVAEASLGGLLANLGGRLTDGIATKYTREITDNIRTEVSK